MYLGKHRHLKVFAEAELISEAAREVVEVICLSFVRSYLFASCHLSDISVPRHCHLRVSFFTGDILLPSVVSNLNSTFLLV